MSRPGHDPAWVERRVRDLIRDALHALQEAAGATPDPKLRRDLELTRRRLPDLLERAEAWVTFRTEPKQPELFGALFPGTEHGPDGR